MISAQCSLLSIQHFTREGGRAGGREEEQRKSVANFGLSLSELADMDLASIDNFVKLGLKLKKYDKPQAS